MRRLILFSPRLALGLSATALTAQTTTAVHPGKGGSPHVRTEWKIDGATISIEYGRPSMKGRPESQLMPPGKEWRTGADEATTLKTDRTLRFGSLVVPAGTYQIHSVPGPPSWQLIISKSTQAWGIPVSGRPGPGAHADDRRQDGRAGRAAHDLD